jgi:hypothetical protein
MKWNIENNEKLIELINFGKRHKEIADLLKTSIRSITNQCIRLGVKTIYQIKLNCNECKNDFLAYIKENRKFCSKKCSAKFNNKKRLVTTETKEKIKKSLKGRKVGDRIQKPPKVKIKANRKCKSCSNDLVTIKHKSICENCRVNYYQYYRPSCEFDFNINDYRHKFDFSLVNEYGWYSPKNKGNNLNGVSRDHIYSVKDGFLNKIAPEIIKHPANCKILKHLDNNRKGYKSLITIEELQERINNWLITSNKGCDLQCVSHRV